MPLSFENELRAFLKHKYEQTPEVQRYLVQGKIATDPMDGISAVSAMIGAHNEALLIVAQEIDKLRATTEEA